MINFKSITSLLSQEAANDLYHRVKSKRDKWMSQIAKLLLRVQGAEATMSALVLNETRDIQKEAPSAVSLLNEAHEKVERGLKEAPNYRGTVKIGNAKRKWLPKKPPLPNSRGKIKALAQTKIGSYIVPILLEREMPLSSRDLIEILATRGVAVTVSNMSNFTTVYCQKGYLKQLRYTKQSKRNRSGSYWVLPNYPKSSYQALGFEEWGKQLNKRNK